MLAGMRRSALALALLFAGCSVGGTGEDGGKDGRVPGEGGADAASTACSTDFDCGDRIACTIDHCESSVCTHEACIDCCPEGLECIVGAGCGAVERCTDDPECSDGVRCTLDICRDADHCEHRPQNELCESGESCFPSLGCIPSPPETCDTSEDCTGGNECLGTWSCQPEFGCQFIAPPECSDDDACTVDSCDVAAGMCVNPIRDADDDGYGDAACGADDCNDANDAVHPDAAETCNGVDDDCDDAVDEGCCATAVPCTTTCGTTGMTTCNADGTPGPCMPPAEVCNGVDDDCNASPDDTFECVRGATRSCTTSCGGTGTQSCDDCTWGACAAGAEVCGGGDDDCDGMIDEGFACVGGSSGSCPTTCGSTGTRACLGDCSWDTCAPPAEICNGVDDDCDSACDDGFMCCRGSTRACNTLGFLSGTAVCRTDCGGYDTTGCSNCGNSVINTGEQCDGSALGGNTCTTVPGGFGSGTLRCTAGCVFDTSSCSRCGNATLDPGEQCDGTALGGNTCASVPGGFTGGTLGCTTACTFNTSACIVFSPTGTYSMSPAPTYTCAFGLVNFNGSTMSLSVAGTTMTLTMGGLPCSPMGIYNPATRSFSLTCTAPGTCAETYTLSGMFTSDNVWTGTFRAQYVGGGGACFGCAAQMWSVTGTRT